MLTDGPEPLKENDLRTASLIIEVFGENLVSTLTPWLRIPIFSLESKFSTLMATQKVNFARS